MSLINLFPTRIYLAPLKSGSLARFNQDLADEAAGLRDADIAGKPSSLRYAQVQALKFLQTKATPPAARRATRRRKVARAVAGRGGQ